MDTLLQLEKWLRCSAGKQEIKLLLASTYPRGTRKGPLAFSIKKDRLVNLSLIDLDDRILTRDPVLPSQ